MYRIRFISGSEARTASRHTAAGSLAQNPLTFSIDDVTVTEGANPAQGGEGVGAMWGEEKTREYLQKAGFRSITTRRQAHDIRNNWYAITK